MRSALRRGHSIFRATPGARQRDYLRVTLIRVRPGEVCTTSLQLARGYVLLQNVLTWACELDDRKAKQQTLLLLRCLARRYEDSELVLHCNQQLRDLWRQEHQQ
jgi:hypothetical protein